MQLALKNELVVAISNKNYAGVGNMLDTWMEHVKRAGVTNAMVVALDEPTRQHAESQGFASMIFKLEVRMQPALVQRSGRSLWCRATVCTKWLQAALEALQCMHDQAGTLRTCSH